MGMNTTFTPEEARAFTWVEKSVLVAVVKVCVSLMVTPVFWHSATKALYRPTE